MEATSAGIHSTPPAFGDTHPLRSSSTRELGHTTRHVGALRHVQLLPRCDRLPVYQEERLRAWKAFLEAGGWGQRYGVKSRDWVVGWLGSTASILEHMRCSSIARQQQGPVKKPRRHTHARFYARPDTFTRPAKMLLVPMPEPCGTRDRLMILMPPLPNTLFSCSSSDWPASPFAVSVRASALETTWSLPLAGREMTPAQIKDALRRAAGA